MRAADATRATAAAENVAALADLLAHVQIGHGFHIGFSSLELVPCVRPDQPGEVGAH